VNSGAERALSFPNWDTPENVQSLDRIARRSVVSIDVTGDVARRVHARRPGDRSFDAGDAMLLKLTEELPLDASIEEVWNLLRDTPRLARLLPGVDNVAPLNEEGVEAYAASLSEKIGPFKITMNLEVRVTEAIAPIQLKAAIKGADSMALNRITGSMQVSLRPASPGTQMQFEASIEILGKLATLGAVPIRRRTTQAFAEFAQNIRAQFAKDPGPS